jgi:hypothetical protein
VPGKEERVGAHRNGGSTVRRRKRRQAAAFVGGEGAPVGCDSGCGVLQHRRGKGVRKLQEIAGIGSSGRSSQGSGGRWRCSAGIHKGEWVACGRRLRSVCGERWGGSGAREEESERSGDGRTSGAAREGSERLGGSAAEGKRGGKRWGPGVGVPRGAAVPWGLAPTSGRHPVVARVRRSRVTCAARALPAETERGEASDGWAAAQCRAAVSLTGGAGLSAGAGRARVARRRAWAGPRRKRGCQAQMNSKVSHLFELV